MNRITTYFSHQSLNTSHQRDFYSRVNYCYCLLISSIYINIKFKCKNWCLFMIL